jgi:hypothetical protein
MKSGLFWEFKVCFKQKKIIGTKSELSKKKKSRTSGLSSENNANIKIRVQMIREADNGYIKTVVPISQVSLDFIRFQNPSWRFIVFQNSGSKYVK